MTNTAQPVVVVTGASTGIGEACVEMLVEAGFFVFGSVRKEADAAKLQQRFGANFAPLLFDVTDRDAVLLAAGTVDARLQGRTLAGLVNNAGFALQGPLLYQPVEDFRQQIEVNLIGQLQVVQAFAPQLGAGPKRQGPPGRIVTMSSVAGTFALPFLGAYSISKHGLEALSDVLRRELMVFGVDVVVIQPGVVKTPIWDKAEQTETNRYTYTIYGPPLQRAQKQVVESGRNGPSARHVATAVLRALTQRRPPARIPVGAFLRLGAFLRAILPTRIVDGVVAKRLGLMPPKGDADPR